MFIQGKIVEVFPLQSGESARGKWRKKEFVIESYAKIPKKVCISLRGEIAESHSLNVGDSIKAHIDLESREHNGRWYTEVRTWKIEPATSENDSSGDEGADTFSDDAPPF